MFDLFLSGTPYSFIMPHRHFFPLLPQKSDPLQTTAKKVEAIVPRLGSMCSAKLEAKKDWKPLSFEKSSHIAQFFLASAQLISKKLP